MLRSILLLCLLLLACSDAAPPSELAIDYCQYQEYEAEACDGMEDEKLAACAKVISSQAIRIKQGIPAHCRYKLPRLPTPLD